MEEEYEEDNDTPAPDLIVDHNGKQTMNKKGLKRHINVTYEN